MAKQPSFDFCKIRTDRLRALDARGIRAVHQRFMRQLYRGEAPERRSPQGLVIEFVNNLFSLKPSRERRGVSAQEQEWARADADRLERKIWTAQAKRGCRISPAEQIARDAERQGGVSRETIDRLRGKRRARIH